MMADAHEDPDFLIRFLPHFMSENEALFWQTAVTVK